MLGLPLIFTAPLVLAAFVGLPALYLLLRVTPPRPRQVPFPPLRLILDQKPADETPARTPLWLLMLRLAIAGVIILAMAGPIWNPPIGVASGAGPLALLIDDGFASAPDWDLRVAHAAERLADAGRAGHPVALAGLSQGGRDPRRHDGRAGARPVARTETRSLPARPVVHDPCHFQFHGGSSG